MEPQRLLLPLLLLSLNLQAQIYVDSTATGASNGTSWANAYPTLQDALDPANLPSGAVEIYLAQGTYYPDEGGSAPQNNERKSTFTLPQEIALYGGFPIGGATFDKRDPVLYPTLLSGDLQQDGPANRNDDAHHVITLSTTDEIILDGLTITLGNTEDGTDERGGAIHAPIAAQLILRNSIVDQNISEDHAGGIYLANGSSATIEDCQFNENGASSNGGAIYASSSVITLSNTTFDDNAAFRGGAVYGLSTSGNWDDVLFAENNATNSGGAVYLITAALGHQLTACTFRENTAAGQDGGALLESGSPSSYLSCLFEGNSAGDDGGAVSTSTAGSVFEDCRFKGNAADDDGGALFLLAASPDIIDCAFHGNAAGGEGGGLILTTNSQARMSGSWIWQNSASSATNTFSASASIPPRTPSTFLDYFDDKSYLANFQEAPLLYDGMNGPEIQVAGELDPLASPQTGGDLRLVYPSLTVARNINGLIGPDLQDKFLIAEGDVIALRATLAVAAPFDVIYLPAGSYDLLDESLVIPPGVQLGSSPAEYTLSSQALSITPTQPVENPRLRPHFFNFDTVAPPTLFTLQGSATLFNININSGRATEPPSLVNLGSSIRAASSGDVKIYDSEVMGGIHSDGSNLALIRTRMTPGSFTAESISISNADLTLLDTCLYRTQEIRVTNGSLSAINTEFGGLLDGAIIADNSPVTLTNCGFTRSLPSTRDHDIQILNNSSLTATNTFAWGYERDSSFDLDWIEVTGGSTASYSHCLIQGLNPSGAGNLNGNLASNDPLLIDFDTQLGRLSIERALPSHLSNCIDAGLSSANATEKDINDSLRIRGSQIDIGPHEHHRIYVDESATLAATGESWATALRDLPADLTAVRGATSIYVAEGEYAQAVRASAGLQLFGGFPSGGSSFASRQPAVHETQLTGGVSNLNTQLDNGNIFNILSRPSLDVPGTVDGFVFADYLTESNAPIPQYALILGSIQNVENCIFRNNRDARGLQSGVNNGGPAIRIPAGIHSSVRHCLFEQNSANAFGGAVNIFSSFQPAAANEGLFVGSGTHYFEDCLFFENSAFNGGTVMFYSDTELYQDEPNSYPAMLFQFEDCVFKGNNASNSGGAVHLFGGAFGTFRDCVMQGNSAGLTGGVISRDLRRDIANRDVTNLNLTNCSLQGNRASALGGAVDGTADYINTILWGNDGLEGNDNYTRRPNNNVTPNSFQNCVVEGINLAEQPEATNTWTGNLDGTDPSNAPQFHVEAFAAEAPTLRGDLRLTTGSPLLDAGTNPNSGFMASNPEDLDGDNRFQGSAIALGAYETPVASFYTPTETALWESDLDGDGTSHGAELLLGTDPNVFDPTHPNAFTLLSAETNPGAITEAEMTLGVSPTAPANAFWVVSRSFTLEGNSFQPVIIFDGTNFNDANPSGPSSNSFTLTNGLINLSSRAQFLGDNGFANHPKVFYRFEAQRAPDFSYPN